MCGARRVPGAQTSCSDSKSPVLSVTNLCADRPRNRGPVVLPHPSELPSPAQLAPRDRSANHHSHPTAVARVEGYVGLNDRYGRGKSQTVTSAIGL